MKNITTLLQWYRESVRNLWNTTFMSRQFPKINFDTVDRFREIQDVLFTELVLCELGQQTFKRSTTAEPFEFLRVVPLDCGEIPISIERPSSDGNKYWDDPVTRVMASDIDLRFIAYFDWNELDFRDLKFYRCRIVAFPRNPHLVGRDALLEVSYGNVLLDQNWRKHKPKKISKLL